MKTVGLEALKNNLSKYVRAATAGETVRITDRDRVAADLRLQADVRALLARVDILEIAPHIVERMYRPFPTAHYSPRLGMTVRLASCDAHMNAAAAALGIPLCDLQ